MSDKINLLLRSRDKFAGSSSNFNVSFQTNQYTGKFVRFKRVMFPLSYYNINSSSNSLSVDIGAGTQTVSLTIGQYSLPSLLASEIQTKLITLDATFLCSYSSLTSKLTISRTGNFTILTSISTTNDILGFNTINKTGSASYSSDNSVLLDPNTCITVHTDLISSTFECTDYRSDVSLVVPITQDLGTYINYYPNISEWFPSSNRNTTSVHVELRDAYNNILELNGLPVDIEIEFSNVMY